MKYLKTFESFIIPKGIRKSFWKDEDIALQVLEELKSLKGDTEGISKLSITEVEHNTLADRNMFKFEVDGFKFEVVYCFVLSPGGGRNFGSLKMDGKELSVSEEVCKKIKQTIIELKNWDEKEMEASNKWDFRQSRGLIK